MTKADVNVVDPSSRFCLQGLPLIDVRAPIEFAKGALPGAVNLPFINNEERHLIGICYKEHGQQAAIDLGHQLVQGIIKDSRLQAWQGFLHQHPNALIYCARGGLRSQISQRWLLESGVACTRIQGGFSAMRQRLMADFENACNGQRFTILSGMTGTGKTDIIKTLSNSLDLEGIANHKGSSFGRPLDKQPTQIDFEHALALSLLKLNQANQANQDKPIIIEDESRSIGGVHLPEPLNKGMAAGNIVVIEVPLEERIQKLLQEYVIERYADTVAYYKGLNQNDVQDNYEERAEQAFSDYLTDSLMRVEKRLGGQRSKEIMAMMKAAIKHQHNDGFSSHEHWLRAITVDYYDPMYVYQLAKRKENVVFTGNKASVMQMLHEH